MLGGLVVMGLKYWQGFTGQAIIADDIAYAMGCMLEAMIELLLICIYYVEKDKEW